MRNYPHLCALNSFLFLVLYSISLINTSYIIGKEYYPGNNILCLLIIPIVYLVMLLLSVGFIFNIAKCSTYRKFGAATLGSILVAWGTSILFSSHSQAAIRASDMVYPTVLSALSLLIFALYWYISVEVKRTEAE